MIRRDIERGAKLVIGQELLFNPQKITDNSEFARDLQADRLDMRDVRAALEQRFGIKITEREMGFCQTVGTAIDLIETKLENRRAA